MNYQIKSGAKWNIINLICVSLAGLLVQSSDLSAPTIILFIPFVYFIVRSFFVCNLDSKYFKWSAILTICSIFMVAQNFLILPLVSHQATSSGIDFGNLIWALPIVFVYAGGILLFFASFILFLIAYKTTKKNSVGSSAEGLQMRYIAKPILTVAILILVLAGTFIYSDLTRKPAPIIPAPSSNNPVVPAGWKTLSTVNYDISYPPDFDLNYLNNECCDLIISFPDANLKNISPTFSNASLNMLSSSDDFYIKNCYTSYYFAVNPVTNIQKVKINGVEFYKGLDSGRGDYRELYNTIHNNKCYEFGLVLRTGSNTSPEADKEKVFTTLRQILNTFTFTK